MQYLLSPLIWSLIWNIHVHLPLFKVFCFVLFYMGLPSWLSCKESACNVGDLGSIPELGRSPGEGNGNPLQYSCLGNSLGRGAWQAYSP